MVGNKIYMNRNNSNILKQKLAAFTILEICIVIGFVGILSSLFFSSIQRFNLLLKNEVEIKQELTNFFMTRSAIWKDIDDTDSISIRQNIMYLFLKNKQFISYKIVDDQLVREIEQKEIILPHRILNIGLKNNTFFATFFLNGQQFDLNCPLRESKANQINAYYSEKKW